MDEQMLVRPGRECRVCGENRRAEMKTDRRAQDGHEKICRACNRERDRAYYEAHTEKKREYNRAYHEAHAEAIHGRKRAYYEANAEKERERKRAWREANAEKTREYDRAWRAANPEKKRAQKHRRRARLNGSTCPPWTAADWAEILDAHDCLCHVCGSADIEMEHGHRVPIKREGGCNGAHNIIPLCWECNRGRGGQHSRNFWEWLPERLAHLRELGL